MKIECTTQAEEIATIKPRTVTIDLSDADVKRLYAKAYGSGITPGELLAGFIGDLIGGTYTHGSDERNLARQYFERCCYGMGLDRSFLQWALQEYRIGEIAALLNAVDEAESDLDYYSEYPEESDSDGVQVIKDAKTDAEKELAAIHDEYKAAENAADRSYTDDINAVRRYLEEVQTVTERGNG